MTTCQMIIEGQEHVCYTCGLRFDINDKDKACGQEPLSREEISKRLKQLRSSL